MCTAIIKPWKYLTGHKIKSITAKSCAMPGKDQEIKLSTFRMDDVGLPDRRSSPAISGLIKRKEYTNEELQKIAEENPRDRVIKKPRLARDAAI